MSFAFLDYICTFVHSNTLRGQMSFALLDYNFHFELSGLQGHNAEGVAGGATLIFQQASTQADLIQNFILKTRIHMYTRIHVKTFAIKMV